MHSCVAKKHATASCTPLSHRDEEGGTSYGVGEEGRLMHKVEIRYFAAFLGEGANHFNVSIFQ